MISRLGDVVFGADQIMCEWVARRIPTYEPSEKDQGIGVYRDGHILAAVAFSDFTPTNIVASIAAVPRSRWVSRRVLHAFFHYPFVQLGVGRITVLIADTNEPSLRLAMGLGFEPEAILERAAPDGGNMIVLRMFSENCRWIARDEQRWTSPNTAERPGNGASGGPVQPA